jgi:hypothetical protein
MFNGAAAAARGIEAPQRMAQANVYELKCFSKLEEKMSNETGTFAVKEKKVVCRTHAADAVYGLGFIGAAIYFISQAATFWLGVLGVLKALVWPAFLVYAALKALNLQ